MITCQIKFTKILCVCKIGDTQDKVIYPMGTSALIVLNTFRPASPSARPAVPFANGLSGTLPGKLHGTWKNVLDYRSENTHAWWRVPVLCLRGALFSLVTSKQIKLKEIRRLNLPSVITRPAEGDVGGGVSLLSDNNRCNKQYMQSHSCPAVWAQHYWFNIHGLCSRTK